MQTGYQAIIDKYYPLDNELRHILLTHSRSVAHLALALAKQHAELQLDLQFIEEAAMLHDIGIVLCNAPSIHCFGTHPLASRAKPSKSSNCPYPCKTSCPKRSKNSSFVMPISFLVKPNSTNKKRWNKPKKV